MERAHDGYSFNKAAIISDNCRHDVSVYMAGDCGGAVPVDTLGQFQSTGRFFLEARLAECAIWCFHAC